MAVEDLLRKKILCLNTTLKGFPAINVSIAGHMNKKIDR